MSRRTRRAFPAAAPVLALILSCAAAFPAAAGDGAGEWLDRAADARLDARRREYAAQRVLMLADSSASILIAEESGKILIAALKGEDGSDSALRRQVAATLLGELDETAPPETEAALLEAAFGTDYFLAGSAKKALAAHYSRLPDNALYTLLTRGAREFSPAENTPPQKSDDDWLALSLRQAEYRGRYKALVMAGLARKYAAGSPSLPRTLPEPLTWCVRDGLLDPESSLRAASVEVLPAIADAVAVERLAALLYTETDTDVLLAALGVMARLRPPQFGEAVERHASHAEPVVSVAALEALHAMGYAGALNAAAKFVNHPSTPVRRRVIGFLAGSKNPAAVAPLEAALFDRVGANRAAAAWGLGELGFPSAVGALHPLLNDSRPEVREEAAVALGKFGVVGVASRMTDAVRSDAALPFRLAAVRALGRMGDRRAVPALAGCLGAAEFPLVAAAVDALALIGDGAAARPLSELLEKTDDLVIEDAARNALQVINGMDAGGGEASEGRTRQP